MEDREELEKNHFIFRYTQWDDLLVTMRAC